MKKLVRIALCCLFPIFLAACWEDTASKGLEEAYRSGYQQCLSDIKQKTSEQLASMRGDISGHLVLTSVFAFAAVVFGPSIAERARTRVVDLFQLDISQQQMLAHCTFWGVLTLCIIGTCTIPELQLVRPAVLILAAGSAYVFLTQLLPAITISNKANRKQAVGKIKSLLFLILVFYILLRILSDRGFLNLTLKPT